jgi:hypothetical protein
VAWEPRKADVSMVAASWIWQPEDIVARGEIMTLFSSVVGVDVDVGVVGDVEVDAGPPIMDFSPIIHPSPIAIGPSWESSFARGCTTVPAPMVIGCVPWRIAESGMIAVGWAVSGGLAMVEELDRGADVLDGRAAEDGLRSEWLGAAGVDMVASEQLLEEGIKVCFDDYLSLVAWDQARPLLSMKLPNAVNR